METETLKQFSGLLSESINSKEFIKISLSNKRSSTSDLKIVFAKMVILKKGKMLSFIYRYPTKDITKNYDIDESISLIEAMIKNDFYQVELFTLKADWQLISNSKNHLKLLQKPASIQETPSFTHDKIKQRMVSSNNNIYFQELGITSPDGKIKKDMEDKYRQLNKYIEIVDSIIKSAEMPRNFKIADMGSGKGYLTFALYDHIVNSLKLFPEIIGIELRKELVEHCNLVAKKASFTNLKFQEGSIENSDITSIDMLIALHACDTATDDAIAKGIKQNSKIIICAPCCQKQIRKQINPDNDLKEITKFGILEERQAEILTDGIRALILEAYGYKTKVFEFISTEHTPKNVMITAVKKSKETEVNQEILQQIKNIKKFYNIEFQQLEKLLGI